jgi:DNA-binding NarL/FixJ family response regulator
MSTLKKIFIADDHQMFIDGLKALLQSISDIEIIGEANNGKQLLERIERNLPDIILMDIGMPEMNGISAAANILALYPNIKIIAITMFDNSNYISKMIVAGAKGYILKNTSKHELLMAIETVSNGGTYYSAQAALNVVNSLVNKNNNPVSMLTERELEIIGLIVKSLTNKQIADKLCISELTVNTHRKNAMRKLDIKNTAGLVKFAIDNNISG